MAAHVDPLPAGLCGFDNYLDSFCDPTRTPSFAVLIPPGANPSDLAIGYPFTASTDDLPIAGRPAATIVRIAGLFDDEAPARALARDVRGIVERIGPKPEPCASGECLEAHLSAVEILHTTPAWSEDDLERVWDENHKKPWVALPENFERMTRDVEALRPICTVEKGTVHAARGHLLYDFMRRFAPVKCADGRDAFVPWRATRLESTVMPSDVLVQVVLVICDVPTLEIRSFSRPPPVRPTRLTDEACD